MSCRIRLQPIPWKEVVLGAVSVQHEFDGGEASPKEVTMVLASRTLRDGLIVGLIGYFSVAALYGAFDLIAARGAMYTVDLLGKSVFRGLRDPAVLGLPMEPDVTAIFWYSGLHLLIALTIGVIVVRLVEQADRQPSQARMVLFTIVAGFVVTIVAVGLLTSPLRPVLPWWSIVVANALAVLLAGTYLLWKRPDTWRQLNPFSG